MGIHIMVPLFEMVIKPIGKEELIIDWEPLHYDNFGIFSNVWYGNTFLPPCKFKLTKIEVRYNKCVATYCANGILHVYDTPTVDRILPPLIATSTIAMPTLVGGAPGIWVPFTFDQPLLLKDHPYLFLSEGCSPHYTKPFHCTYAAYHAGTGIEYCMWTWDNITFPPDWQFAKYKNSSLSHKIWGIKT